MYTHAFLLVWTVNSSPTPTPTPTYPPTLFNVLCISYLAYIPTEVPASEPKSNTLVSELCHRCSAVPASMLNDLAIQKYKSA